MHWTQLAYPVGLAVAVWIGRPDWRPIALLYANFFGTILLSESKMNVAILDLATVAALIYVFTRFAIALACVFAAIIPVYALGAQIGWPSATTYAIVDLAALAIWGIVAGGGSGTRIVAFDPVAGWLSGRPFSAAGYVSARNHRQDT